MRLDVAGWAHREAGGRAPSSMWMRPLRVAISIALLGILAVSVEHRELLRALASVDFGPFGIACLLPPLGRLLVASRWHALLVAQGVCYSYADLLRIVWVSSFLGGFLPATVGVDAARFVGASRARTKKAAIAASIVFERTSGLVALSFMIVVGAAALPDTFATAPLLWTSAALLAVTALPVLVLWSGFVSAPVRWLLARAGSGRPAELLRSLWQALALRPPVGTMLRVLVLACGGQLVRVGAVYFCSRALALPLSFTDLLLVVPIVLFVSLLPLSIGGWGVREATLVVLVRSLGLSPTDALALALIARVPHLLSGGVGGLIFLFLGLMPRWQEPSTRGREDAAP